MSDRRKLPEYWIPQDLKDVLNSEKPSEKMLGRREKFRNILQQLEKIDRLELVENQYFSFFKLALYLEEFEQTIDQQKYDMYRQKIEPVPNAPVKETFKIWMNNFDRDHPLRRSSTYIEVYLSKMKFVLKVNQIFNDYVTTIATSDFSENYSPDNLYDIKFDFNNYSFRCSHYVLYLLYVNKMTKYVFPKKIDSSPTFNTLDTTSLERSEQIWYNESIANNPEQKQAVRNIVRKSSHPAPYILYGPPGTGKTATLVETMCQIYRNSDENILVCTPSNAAADEITTRLLNYIPVDRLYRLYSLSRGSTQISEEMKTCSNCSTGGKISKIDHGNIVGKRIVITTLCTCTKLSFMDEKTYFSYIFIDEAGQSTEPESLIAFNASRNSFDCQIIISGDPQQLGPVVRSKYAAPILGQSMMERLMKLDLYNKQSNNEYDSRYITTLIRNYRNDPSIIRVSNELYYENRLIACSTKSIFTNKTFSSEFPIIFHAVDGDERKEGSSTSCYNEAEINEVMNYVNMLLGQKIGNKTIAAKDIGIVTPFALQTIKLQRLLKQVNLEELQVGTVEVFQGQERDVIIISTVRSKAFWHEEREHIGHLSNPRRFNVALTRARSLLVVLGNPSALQTDDNWRYFIQFCVDNDACRGPKFTLKDKDTRNARASGPICALSNDVCPEASRLLLPDDGLVKDGRRDYKLYYEKPTCTVQ